MSALTPPSQRLPPPLLAGRPLLLLLLIALAYAVSGRLGLLLAIPPGYATALFPPAGLALAACLQFGYRALPGIWLGSMLMNLSVSWPATGWPPSATWLLTAGLGAGAALQALVGTLLVRRSTGLPLQWNDERTLWRFSLAGGAISTLVSASVGVGLLWQLDRIPPSDVPFSWLTWWVGDSIGVLIIAPLLLLALAPAGSESRQQLRAILLPISVTFMLVTLVFIRAADWENQQLHERFRNQASQLGNALRDQFERQLDQLQQLERFFASSDDVTAEEFAIFTGPTLSHEQGSVAFSWVRVIAADQRNEFEHEMRRRGLTDFLLWQRDGNGNKVSAERRAQAFPISYIEPASSYWLRGFDNASEPHRRAAIETAIARRQLSVSEPLRLNQLDPSQRAVLAVMPVERAGSDSVIRDLVVVAIRPTPLVEAVVSEGLASGIHIQLQDQTAVTDDNLLYQSDGSGNASNGFTLQQEWLFGDQRWQLELAATPAYLARQHAWQAWLVLVAGMLFTGLTGAVLMLTHGRAIRVQRLVEERTAELRQQQQTLQTITDSTPDAVLLIDRRGNILMANPATERLLQNSAPRLRGQALSAWLPDWHPDWLHDAEQHGPAGWRHETRLQQPGGTIRDVEIALTRLQHAGEERYCCLLHDLTDRIAVERLKREFVAMVSHELRTPLTSIRGALALLRGIGIETDLNQSRQLLKMADENSKRLLLLVNDLLDFEKLEMGKLEVPLQPVLVAPLLSTVIADMQGFAVSHQVTLRLESTLAADCQANLAPDRLIQVLNNLLSNAIKFSPPGASVLLNARSDGERLVLEVVDRGIGIATANQGNIFQKFWQADGSASRRHSGTGLGLAISKGLIEAMAGRIGFHSETGKGSTFWVELPLLSRAEATSTAELTAGNSTPS